jgi:hypothetical protein
MFKQIIYLRVNIVFRYTINIFPNISTQFLSELIEETKLMVLLAKRRMNCFIYSFSSIENRFLERKSYIGLISQISNNFISDLRVSTNNYKFLNVH